MVSEAESSVQDMFEERIARITEACSFCGKCFEVCPMTPFAGLQEAESETVVRGVIDIINGKPHVKEAASWAGVCQKSGLCIEACPEDVNPREMLSYAKIKLQMASNDSEEISGRSRDYFQLMSRTLRLMAGLQLEPERFKRLTAVHNNKKAEADAVFYFGCNILKTPHILLSCIDVLDRMGLDYEVAGGVGHCCGINHIRRGDLEAGAAMGKNRSNAFVHTIPKRSSLFVRLARCNIPSTFLFMKIPGNPFCRLSILPSIWSKTWRSFAPYMFNRWKSALRFISTAEPMASRKTS